MPVNQILPEHDEATRAALMEGKHLVINCRTSEVFAADDMDEANLLAYHHALESHKINPDDHPHPGNDLPAPVPPPPTEAELAVERALRERRAARAAAAADAAAAEEARIEAEDRAAIAAEAPQA
jgi:hypothetical protein